MSGEVYEPVQLIVDNLVLQGTVSELVCVVYICIYIYILLLPYLNPMLIPI